MSRNRSTTVRVADVPSQWYFTRIPRRTRRAFVAARLTVVSLVPATSFPS